MGSELPMPAGWSVLPFIFLLVAIALVPLFWAHAWERHYPKLAVLLAALVIGYYLLVLRAGHRVLEVGHEYVSFIALIGALFVVAGGIHISVKGEATPLRNVLYLFVGGVVANLFGTTGASMLLVRPWIRMNKYRITGFHIVFFIFIVSNIGGCLTPVGDPPLFIGYLRGVPFTWVAQRCWPMWIAAMLLLLLIFYVLDSINYRKAPAPVRQEQAGEPEQWRVAGLANVFFMAIILGLIFLKNPPFLREVLMCAVAAVSWVTTAKAVHEANHFTFHPAKEIGILFFGLFATMMPAIDLIQANAHRLGHPGPGLFYWSCGILSSVLDNAPTYLTFFSAAFALSESAQAGAPFNPETVAGILRSESTFNHLLVPISVAAVFFGANTYIGNAPNLMVKSIADHQKVHTPHFVGYVLKYSLPFLLPVLVVVWLLFFRG